MSPVEILQDYIHEKEKELRDLRIGLAALQAALSNKPMPVEPSVAPPTAPLQSEVAEETAQPAPIPPPKPVYTGPVCSACGNKMYPSYRTMPSGAMVSLMKCNDSACGNEVYQ
jgi:hypothetical protein